MLHFIGTPGIICGTEPGAGVGTGMRKVVERGKVEVELMR